MAKRIVITGGPGTGKTVLVRRLEEMGYPCFHEIIREMTLEARERETTAEQVTNPLVFVSDPLAFNKKILEVFYDRGIPDVLAYMDYFQQPFDGYFSEPCRLLRYDTVVVLPPWREIYIQDGARLENFEQACEIHDCLEARYRASGYMVQTLETGPVDRRIEQLLELIADPNG
jgi:predicted ATPase